MSNNPGIIYNVTTYIHTYIHTYMCNIFYMCYKNITYYTCTSRYSSMSLYIVI